MFSTILRALREEKGLSQKELADVLGVSRPAITKYERIERQPDFKTVEQIADFFNVSVDYLLGRTNIRNPYLHASFSSNSTATHKNAVENILQETQDMLLGSTNLTLSGDPASPEAVQSIIDGIKFGLEQAKMRNKKKQD